MVLHVDGDAFFVGCELTRRPELRGLPVVTGAERGIASAMSYEAKRLGVTRGYPIFKLRKEMPQVIVLPGDYELYEQMSRRMYEVVRRYSNCVEEYSIDECFATLEAGESEARLLERANEIKDKLFGELGMTFSMGLAPTKVLAKLGSKRDKPSGCVVVTKANIERELYGMSLEKVWGIGPRTWPILNARGILTVGDFARASRSWLADNFASPIVDLQREILGEVVYQVHEGNTTKNLSIQKTRTFHPSTTDTEVLMSQLAKNTENAFAKLRSLELAVREAQMFIKSTQYRYRTRKFKFLAPIQTPEVLFAKMRDALASLIRPNELYRSTGVTLVDLVPAPQRQASGKSGSLPFVPPLFPDLFGASTLESKRLALHDVADTLYHKYGGHILTSATAMSARSRSQAVVPPFGGGTASPSPATLLGLPFLGLVC